MGSWTNDPVTQGQTVRTLSRRTFIAWAAASVAAAAVATELAASDGMERSLTFSSCHTGERLAVTYCEAGCYLPSALEEVNHFLRDFRTGEVKAIDPRLLDVLHEVKLATGARASFNVISGFRSASTNAMLRENTSGVSAHSLHMVGKAIDVRLSDVATPRLRDAALRLGRGGVGYYAGPDFVHLDTGRVRRW
jgi:uncharacterized protein YcbK (DUF882 family)